MASLSSRQSRSDVVRDQRLLQEQQQRSRQDAVRSRKQASVGQRTPQNGHAGRSELSSAEGRRRLKALQYGDLEGIELEVVKEQSESEADSGCHSNEGGIGDERPHAQMVSESAPIVMTTLPNSASSYSIARGGTSTAVATVTPNPEQTRDSNTAVTSGNSTGIVGTAPRHDGNLLGARLRMRQSQISLLPAGTRTQATRSAFVSDMDQADERQVAMATQPQQSRGVPIPGVAVAARAREAGTAATHRRMRNMSDVDMETREGTLPNEVTWTSHPAHGTVKASDHSNQRVNLVRSRAKQVHSPDGGLHHGHQETVHLPSGSQAWRESSLLEQRHIDLQLLHITSHGPAEDMTERLIDQNTVKTGILRKAENERASKNRLQLAFQGVKLFYESFRNSKESNPFLKTYIRTVQARYGNGTAAFFIFVRSIIQLNIMMSLLWLGFVVLPTIINKQFRPPPDNSDGPMLLRNLFDGKGPVAKSVLFFGGYSVATDVGSYRLDMAYLLVTIATMYGSFFVVVHWFAHAITSGKQTVHRHDNSSEQSYATTVLSSWEHSSTRSRKAVSNMQAGITTTLKELLDERKRKQKAKKMTKQERYRVYLLRVLAWSIAILLTGGAIAGLVYLSQATSVVSSNQPLATSNTTNNTSATHNSSQAQSPAAASSAESGSADQIREFGFALSFVAINAIVPAIIELLVVIEYYATERIETMVTLVRVFAVRMFNIYVLVYTLNTRINQAQTDSLGCGGSYFGQELYKVIVIESLLQPTAKLVKHYLFFYWTNTRDRMNVSQALLGAVYMEALIWTGTPFCPLLPVLGTFSFSLIFLAYYRIVMDTCHPPEKRWTQSRHDPLFIFMLVLSSVVVMAPISIYLTTQQTNMGQITSTSTVCGPYNESIPLKTFVRTISTSDGDSGLFSAILDWTFSKTVLVPLAAIVISICHYMHMRGTQLSRQLNTMGRDWAVERQSMKTHLSFISACKCRPQERDKILKGTAGEYFDNSPLPLSPSLLPSPLATTHSPATPTPPPSPPPAVAVAVAPVPTGGAGLAFTTPVPARLGRRDGQSAAKLSSLILPQPLVTPVPTTSQTSAAAAVAAKKPPPLRPITVLENDRQLQHGYDEDTDLGDGLRSPLLQSSDNSDGDDRIEGSAV